jgi:hypothetical protein
VIDRAIAAVGGAEPQIQLEAALIGIHLVDLQ